MLKTQFTLFHGPIARHRRNTLYNTHMYVQALTNLTTNLTKC